MKVFDGSSISGSGSSFQVPSLSSGLLTCQEQGSPDSPQVFSIPAPRASGHDEFQQALKDPEFAKAVRGLELCLRVRERERLRYSGIDSCRVSNAGRQGLRSKSACGGVDSSGDRDTLRRCYLEDGMEVLRHEVPPTSAVTSSSVVGVSAPCPVRRALVSGIEDDSVFKQNAGVASSSVRRAPVVGEEGDSLLSPMRQSPVAGERVRPPAAGALRRSGPSAHATASESDRVIGLLEVTDSEFPSLSYSVNSCLGLSTSACARASRLAGACAGAAARVCSVSSSSAVSAVAHTHASTLHGAQNSWSDTVRVGSHGHKEGQRWGFQSGRRFASCHRGGGRGKFSASRRCTGAGCRFHSQEATRIRYQACQGRCGHTFPPPGGSWYAIRVTWIRIGHQAINGLDEGVWNRKVGDLGAKGIARACMFPANLDHFRVEWMKRCT